MGSTVPDNSDDDSFECTKRQNRSTMKLIFLSKDSIAVLYTA